MKTLERLCILAVFVATACIIVWLYQAFANYLVTKTYCEATPMNKMSDKQWSDCLELLK